MRTRSILTLALAAMLLTVMCTGTAFAKYPVFDTWPKSELFYGFNADWSQETKNAPNECVDAARLSYLSWNNQWHHADSSSGSVRIYVGWNSDGSQAGVYTGPTLTYGQYHGYCVDSGTQVTGTVGQTYTLGLEHEYEKTIYPYDVDDVSLQKMSFKVV